LVATGIGTPRGCSSAGRAPALQAGGHRFDPGQLHPGLSPRERLKGSAIVWHATVHGMVGREAIGARKSGLEAIRATSTSVTTPAKRDSRPRELPCSARFDRMNLGRDL
jgi:hypothetical protein